MHDKIIEFVKFYYFHVDYSKNGIFDNRTLKIHGLQCSNQLGQMGLTSNTFSSWLDEIAWIIYSIFTRPNLEFASSVWNPHLEYDSKTLESVQCKSNPHERITPLTLKRKAQKARFNQLENQNGEICEIWLNRDIQTCPWSRESELVRWKQSTET